MRLDEKAMLDIEVEVDVALARHRIELLLGEYAGSVVSTAHEHDRVLT